jgi:ankyrin repeat protein
MVPASMLSARFRLCSGRWYDFIAPSMLLLTVIAMAVIFYHQHRERNRLTKELQLVLDLGQQQETPANKVMSLIRRDADVNTVGPWGRTPLMIVSAYGTRTQVRELLLRGAEVDARDVDGNSALMDVAESPDVQGVVQELIAAGAEVNARDHGGRTPLIHAVMGSLAASDSTMVLEVLLRAGADLNAKDNAGMTALRWAREILKDQKVARVLRSRGARVANFLKSRGARE